MMHHPFLHQASTDALIFRFVHFPGGELGIVVVLLPGSVIIDIEDTEHDRLHPVDVIAEKGTSVTMDKNVPAPLPGGHSLDTAFGGLYACNLIPLKQTAGC
jgi:hypothetical protein